MNTVKTIDILNRLLAIHYRSLPMYLRYATPWSPGKNGQAQDTVAQIVASHQEFVDRFTELINASDEPLRFGEFPMAFTGYHDLSFEYLTKVLIERQEEEIQLISNCVEQLEAGHMAKAVAEEALGAAKAHLDALRELP